MLIDLQKTGLLLKAVCNKFRKPFYWALFLIPIFLISSSPVSSAPKLKNKPTDTSRINEDYIKAKLSVERIFSEDVLTISIGQIGIMKKKELTIFKNFMVYCSSFMDLFLKGSHVLYQCRIGQRHFNFQYNKDREVDWLIDDMLTGISFVHDEFGGSRFKENFIIRKRKVEREWIRAINQRYLELEGKSDDDSSPKT